MKAIKWLDEHFEELLLAVFLVLIACVSMIQVICRQTPIPPLTWAEEFCRFMWIMSVFISLPYTIRKGNMLRVSVLLDLMPQVVRKVINLVVDAIVTASMALLTYHCIFVFTKIVSSGEMSPAMRWPMSSIYVVMLIGFALAVLRGVQMLIIHAMHFNERELSTIEQTMADAAEEAAAGKKAEGGEN